MGVKVFKKDDNLGLGCKQNSEDTCTGLGDLQSLLGRLNGKGDGDIKREEDVRRKVYRDAKFGTMFVRGEVLISDWVIGATEKTEVKDGQEENENVEKQEGEVAIMLDEAVVDKKKRKRAESGSHEEFIEPALETAESNTNPNKEERRRAKEARKTYKEAKRLRRELKKLKRKAREEEQSPPDGSTPEQLASGVSTPVIPTSTTIKQVTNTKKSVSLPISLSGSGASTPTVLTGRQALRSKWIAQKRLSVMDAKALNEILMIKT